LNVCPYRAISVFHRRPQVLGFIEATTSLTQGDRNRRPKGWPCASLLLDA
jgi:hypothetical protein